MKFESLAIFVGVISITSILIGLNSQIGGGLDDVKTTKSIVPKIHNIKDEKIIFPKEKITFS